MVDRHKDVMLNAALDYLELGCSIIPCKPDKKPYIAWEEYQNRKPTKIEVLKWWGETYPEASIGVVTGKVSQRVCVDIDNPKIRHEPIDALVKFNPPTAMTPNDGYHLWFLNPEEEVRNSTGFLEGIDFRGEGGYAIVAPSINGNGKAYRWKKHFHETTLVVLPDNIIKLIKGGGRQKHEYSLKIPKIVDDSSCNANVIAITNDDTRLQTITRFFSEGRRDDDLFHAANVMIKGGAHKDFVVDVLLRLASRCNPPFSANEAVEKVKSALNRGDKRVGSVADEVRHWIKTQEGYFTNQECCRDLGYSTPQEKVNVNVILKRLCDKEGLIVRYGAKAGCYRLTVDDCETIDWQSAPTNSINLRWPLGIEDLIEVYPSNICIVAGTPNSGKTSILLEFARLNCKKFKINYFNSEMGPTELRNKLEMWKEENVETWKRINFKQRDCNFSDVIKPDEINIIDYLEVLNDFWKVGEMISEIHKKLKNGIAVIAIQKNKGAELGRGGSIGTEKARLYMNLEFGKLKIMKAKNWRSNDNPNGMVKDYILSGGWKFISDKPWHKDI
jgi:hypothetical protein